MSETEPHVFIHSLPQINTLLYGNYYCQCLQIPLCVFAYKQVHCRRGKCEDSRAFLHNTFKCYPIKNTTQCRVDSLEVLFLMFRMN